MRTDMIPTREEVEADWANPRFTPETTALIWLRAMRDEIDRLKAANEKALNEQERWVAKCERLTMERSIDAAELNVLRRDSLLHVNARAENDSLSAEVDRLTAELEVAKAQENRMPAHAIFEGTCSSRIIQETFVDHGDCTWVQDGDTDVHMHGGRLRVVVFAKDIQRAVAIANDKFAQFHQVQKLRADIDRANTEAALARDALAKANQDPVMAMAKVTREANEAQIREQWDRIRAVTRQIIEVTGAPGPCSMEDAVGFIVAEVGRLRADLEIALAKATTPAPDREAAIRAWVANARRVSIDDPDDVSNDYTEYAAYVGTSNERFIVTSGEIRAASALMRRADGKALLRELRAWICGEWSSSLEFGSIRRILDGIDEMLAQPAPSHIYSRGRTIAESAEPPTAYYPPAPVEIWPEEMKRQTLVGKFEPAPVEQPAAAMPDHLPDTGKMVPVLYWLEDGKFARAMLVGKDLLVVDLTFGDGPSVVGKPEWFDAGYVAAYGGLVPESATQGKEPGQWDYGVASIAKPAAVPDDTRELVAQLADLVAVMPKSWPESVEIAASTIAAKLRAQPAPVEQPVAAVPDDPRWQLVAQLAEFVAITLKGEVNRDEVQAIAKQLRGGA